MIQKNRNNNLVDGAKIYYDSNIEYVPKDYYKLKMNLDSNDENILVNNYAININCKHHDYGKIHFLGNWVNPKGNNNCIRELLLSIMEDKYNLDDDYKKNNLNNENLNENTIFNLDDDYYQKTNYNNYTIDDKFYEELNNYILVISDCLSLNEDSDKNIVKKGTIYVDINFFQNIKKIDSFNNPLRVSFIKKK